MRLFPDYISNNNHNDMTIDFPTMSNGNNAFDLDLGNGWVEVSHSGGHYVYAYACSTDDAGNSDATMTALSNTESTSDLTSHMSLKNMDMDEFGALPDDLTVSFNGWIVDCDDSGSDVPSCWAVCQSGGAS